jgi:hypothetical protein
MKSYLTTIIIIFLSFSIGIAQNAEKIKGNRIVNIQTTDIDSYHTIALDEDFDIEIVYARTPFVEVEADENLHEFINFKVIDSVLTFNKTIKIASKKKLHIKVGYDDALKHIETSGDSKLVSTTTLDVENGSLIARESSKVGLTVKSEKFTIDTDDKSKIKLNLTSKNCVLNMSGNSKLDALINTTDFTAILYQRAQSDIEGSCNTSKIDLDNNSKFNGKNFTTAICNVTCNISSDAYLEVQDTITIAATGTSSVYLYGNPKIIINKLTDTSKLQKKVK